MRHEGLTAPLALSRQQHQGMHPSGALPTSRLQCTLVRAVTLMEGVPPEQAAADRALVLPVALPDLIAHLADLRERRGRVPVWCGRHPRNETLDRVSLRGRPGNARRVRPFSSAFPLCPCRLRLGRFPSLRLPAPPAACILPAFASRLPTVWSASRLLLTLTATPCLDLPRDELLQRRDAEKHLRQRPRRAPHAGDRCYRRLPYLEWCGLVASPDL